MSYPDVVTDYLYWDESGADMLGVATLELQVLESRDGTLATVFGVRPSIWNMNTLSK